ncbi:hypothetical protein C7B61_11920 [filamentous cyanobacterium CCP1]|nr:hypothetical protein C7B76_23460 [filamentous cyanobacterium CCP2]PSB64716.1 hypothetical protein C7B61_11920 [filamentous cyanobacterium CCP1]
MLKTANRSDTLSIQPASFRQAAGLQSGSLSQGSELSVKPARFQNRSSNQNASLSSRRTAQNTLLAIFSGRSPRVTGVGGNSGARSAQRVQAMHNGGRWDFFRNGQFRFTPRGLGTLARTDLFPIVGRFNVRGNILNFSGTRSSGNLTSRNFSAIQGQLSLRSGIANVRQQTSIINGAVINGSRFGSNSNSIVAMTMRMVRIR